MSRQSRPTLRNLDNEILTAANWYFTTGRAPRSGLAVITGIYQASYSDWSLFSAHHSLPGDLPRNAYVLIATCFHDPVSAVVLQPVTAHPPRVRVSRWCTLPQFRHLRLGTTLLAIVARAAMLAPLDLRLLTASRGTVDHLLDTRQWQLLDTRKVHARGRNSSRQDKHSRHPIGTQLFELTPTCLAMIV